MGTLLRTTPFEVLVVDDNPGDLALVEIAFAEIAPQAHIRGVSDGLSALRGLRHDAAAGRLPNLVLLDLDLPWMHGREVLASMKRDPALREVPVVILSSSERDADVVDTYRLGANSFVAKRVELDEGLKAIGDIAQFWINTARVPTAYAG